MSWIDRVNDAVLRRLRSDITPGDGEELIERVDQVTRLIAFVHPGYIGSTMALIAQVEGGRVVHVDDRDSAWHDLLIILDRNGRMARTATEWTLRLMADETTPLVLIGPPLEEV